MELLITEIGSRGGKCCYGLRLCHSKAHFEDKVSQAFWGEKRKRTIIKEEEI